MNGLLFEMEGKTKVKKTVTHRSSLRAHLGAAIQQ